MAPPLTGKRKNKNKMQTWQIRPSHRCGVQVQSPQRKTWTFICGRNVVRKYFNLLVAGKRQAEVMQVGFIILLACMCTRRSILFESIFILASQWSQTYRSSFPQIGVRSRGQFSLPSFFPYKETYRGTLSDEVGYGTMLHCWIYVSMWIIPNEFS